MRYLICRSTAAEGASGNLRVQVFRLLGLTGLVWLVGLPWLRWFKVSVVRAYGFLVPFSGNGVMRATDSSAQRPCEGSTTVAPDFRCESRVPEPYTGFRV